MRTTNALAVRRSLGKVLSSLERSGEPILVERAGEPVAVLISIDDFRARFADGVATEEREALVAEIMAHRRRTPGRRRGTVAEIRALRGKLP